MRPHEISRAGLIYRTFPCSDELNGTFQNFRKSGDLMSCTQLFQLLLSCCLFVFFYHNNTIPVYCVIRLAFEFIPWLFVEWFIFWKVNNSPGSQKNFFETFSSLRKFHNYGSYTDRVGRIEGNHCATLTFNFFQEFCATVNYLIRISANFLFNGLKTNSLRNLWKLFRENFLPNSFPFQLNFCSRTVIDSFPAHKSRPYLIGCLDECLQKPARVEDQSLHRFSFYLRLAVWRILSLKLLPLFSFYFVVIQLVSMYKSCVTQQWEEFWLPTRTVGNREQGTSAVVDVVDCFANIYADFLRFLYGDQ